MAIVVASRLIGWLVTWLIGWLRVIFGLISRWLNVVVGGMIPQSHLFLFFFFGMIECSELSFESCNLVSELLAWITFFWCSVEMGVRSLNVVLCAHIVLEVNAKEWVQ